MPPCTSVVRPSSSREARQNHDSTIIPSIIHLARLLHGGTSCAGGRLLSVGERAIYSVAFIGAADWRKELHGTTRMRGRTPIADFYDLVNSLRSLSLLLSIPLKNAVRALPQYLGGGCSVPVVLFQILWTFSASLPSQAHVKLDRHSEA